MARDLIRAYLAEEVIQLAFRPVSTNDKAKWLALYHKSLAGFWEIGYVPTPPTRSKDVLAGAIPQSPAAVSFDYRIADDLKFSLALLHESTGPGSELLWTHESDPTYYDFPHRRVLTELKRRSQALNNRSWNETDIETVVDGLICHPRVHIHIDNPMLDHSLRVGMGQGNPFLFLFHLRYQACAIDETRCREKRRLCGLFSGAIQKKVHRIPPGELFG